MSITAGKVGTAYASTATAHTPQTGRATFSPDSMIPIEGPRASSGSTPQENAVRDDTGWGEGGAHGWSGPQKPPIFSRFSSRLTTYDVDTLLFRLQTATQGQPIVVNFGTVAQVYSTNQRIISFNVPALGQEYNRLH